MRTRSKHHLHHGRDMGPRARRAMRARRWLRGHPTNDDIVAMLEDYQRDLEEETARVAERIRRLRDTG